MAQSIQSIQAMHELNAQLYNRRNWALGINHGPAPATLEDLENLKAGRSIGSSKKAAGKSSYLAQAEYRLQETETYLKILEGRKTDGINRLKINKYDTFDLKKFNNSPDYQRAVKDYQTAKDDLNKRRRIENEQTAKNKLAYQRAELDGTAARIRNFEKNKIKIGIDNLAAKQRENDLVNNQYRNQINELEGNIKKSTDPDRISATKKAIDRYKKEISDRDAANRQTQSQINNLQGNIDKIDGKTLVRKADNNAKARKANKKVPKLNRRRR